MSHQRTWMQMRTALDTKTLGKGGGGGALKREAQGSLELMKLHPERLPSSLLGENPW